MRFAAIDIGSNAVRLLFANCFETAEGSICKKESIIRVPLRLGEDTFRDRIISEQKMIKLIKTMSAFKELIEVEEVLSYRACATSAMREASNYEEVTERVEAETGIKIEVISGIEEARIIYANHIIEHLDPEKTYLYVDVGGGSTELSLFHKRDLKFSQSFPVGTIKLLHHIEEGDQMKEIKKVVKDFSNKYKSIIGIGSGGNINTLHKLYGNAEQGYLRVDALKIAYSTLTAYSYDERIQLLGMKPDRADVIIPAAEIYLNIMRWCNIKQFLVPKIGLADGIVNVLYEEHKHRIQMMESA